jgi:hypothetical protein
MVGLQVYAEPDIGYQTGLCPAFPTDTGGAERTQVVDLVRVGP